MTDPAGGPLGDRAMRRLRALIHSPAALFAFEAAARHRSFTKAAGELNVSQPAVSLAVKQVEAALGVRLFRREHRRVVLTEAGERFYQDVTLSLAHIRQSAERLAREVGGSHVTLATSSAFANYWVVPRLAAFRAAHPDIDFRLQTTDKDIDLAAEGVSLGIRRGDGRWPGYGARRLTDDEIFPVASPRYLAGRPPLAAAELPAERLIHLEEPYRPRPTWADWFKGQGLAWRDGGEGLRLNDYALVLQAAMAGEGIALGWRHVVEAPIAQGLLVRASPASLITDLAFWVVWSEATPLSDEARQVRDWILSEG